MSNSTPFDLSDLANKLANLSESDRLQVDKEVKEERSKKLTLKDIFDKYANEKKENKYRDVLIYKNAAILDIQRQISTPKYIKCAEGGVIVSTYTPFKFDNSEDLYYVNGRYLPSKRETNDPFIFTAWVTDVKGENNNYYFPKNIVTNLWRDYRIGKNARGLNWSGYSNLKCLKEGLTEYLIYLLDNPITLEKDIPANLENEFIFAKKISNLIKKNKI